MSLTTQNTQTKPPGKTQPTTINPKKNPSIIQPTPKTHRSVGQGYAHPKPHQHHPPHHRHTNGARVLVGEATPLGGDAGAGGGAPLLSAPPGPVRARPRCGPDVLGRRSCRRHRATRRHHATSIIIISTRGRPISCASRLLRAGSRLGLCAFWKTTPELRRCACRPLQVYRSPN